MNISQSHFGLSCSIETLNKNKNTENNRQTPHVHCTYTYSTYIFMVVRQGTGYGEYMNNALNCSKRNRINATLLKSICTLQYNVHMCKLICIHFLVYLIGVLDKYEIFENPLLSQQDTKLPFSMRDAGLYIK